MEITTVKRNRMKSKRSTRRKCRENASKYLKYDLRATKLFLEFIISEYLTQVINAKKKKKI